jgi:hypothetical protein
MSLLEKLNDLIEKNERGNEERVKARWLKLSGGQTVTINFLQEIDEGSPEYNAEVGTILVASEHTNPDNFKKKALCTKETEGQCLGCEYAQDYPGKGWKARGRLYANVLVSEESGEKYVAVLSQGISDKSITPALVSFANDSNSITNIAFKLRRSGVGTATGYSLMPKIGSSGASLEGLELYDLNKSCTFSVVYADQANYYGEYKDEASDVVEEIQESSSISW